MQEKQLSFFSKQGTEHGGNIRIGKRKLARPIDTKSPMHIVMRSSRARGQWSFLNKRNKAHVHLLLLDLADKYTIKIYRFANVGNHLHLLVRTRSRRQFQIFLRRFAGAIAMFITGAKKGNPVGKFWDKIAYSRLVRWGREFAILSNYFVKNMLQSFAINSKNLHISGFS